MADRSRVTEIDTINPEHRHHYLAAQIDEVEGDLLGRFDKLSSALNANTDALRSTSNRMFWTAISLLGSLLVAALAALIALRV